jgi:ribonuclease PH
VPRWRRDSGKGWLTASYQLLPGASSQRTRRDRYRVKGRTLEIERVIGRSLRAALDLSALGEVTVHVDCDVLQADGGTRTASVTGGWLALARAVRSLDERGLTTGPVLTRQVAAVSVGIVRGAALLDLSYAEDSAADVDLNVVMTDNQEYVEIQGTAEGAPVAPANMQRLLSLAAGGVDSLCAMQREALDGN